MSILEHQWDNDYYFCCWVLVSFRYEGLKLHYRVHSRKAFRREWHFDFDLYAEFKFIFCGVCETSTLVFGVKRKETWLCSIDFKLMKQYLTLFWGFQVHWEHTLIISIQKSDKCLFVCGFCLIFNLINYSTIRLIISRCGIWAEV